MQRDINAGACGLRTSWQARENVLQGFAQHWVVVETTQTFQIAHDAGLRFTVIGNRRGFAHAFCHTDEHIVPLVARSVRDAEGGAQFERQRGVCDRYHVLLLIQNVGTPGVPLSHR
ncbi:MAG: hypothetical protein BWY25_03146 [Chloroflexi bacterium ADurb.Bin222]|nr:MAG: hypothetical protein BWY25_03146 [Chloroflexi bacterium ADurb.Bin222]